MMQSKYVKYYCHQCAAITDHVKLSYVDEAVLVCMLCQNEIIKDTMKKSYTVVIIRDEDYFVRSRRQVIVELLCKSVPAGFSEKKPKVESFTIQYTAYGPDHFTASLSKYPGNGFVNHTDALDIAEEIKKFVKGSK